MSARSTIWTSSKSEAMGSQSRARAFPHHGFEGNARHVDELAHFGVPQQDAERRWAFGRRRVRKRPRMRRACLRWRGSSPADPALSCSPSPARPAPRGSLPFAPPRFPNHPGTGLAAAAYRASGATPSRGAADNAGGLRSKARCVDRFEPRARSGPRVRRCSISGAVSGVCFQKPMPCLRSPRLCARVMERRSKSSSASRSAATASKSRLFAIDFRLRWRPAPLRRRRCRRVPAGVRARQRSRSTARRCAR